MKRILRIRAASHSAVEKAHLAIKKIHFESSGDKKSSGISSIKKLPNIVPKKVAQTMNVDLKNVVWKVDPIQSYIMAIKMQKMPVFAEAVNRNMTGIYFKFLDYKVETKENITLEWKGTQRCLSENTPIKVVVGEKVLDKRLKDVRNPFDVVSYNFDKNRLEVKRATRIDSGRRNVLRLRTKFGKEVLATPNHKFFVIRNGKVYEEVLSNIKIGDKLVTIKQ
jgi:hypothetical protein